LTRLSRLRGPAALRPSMSKLDLGLEELSTGAADPSHDRFVDLARFQRIHKAVLIMPPQLAENHNQFDVWDVLVAQAVV